MKRRQLIKLLKQVHRIYEVNPSYRVVNGDLLNRPQSKALQILIDKIRSNLLRDGFAATGISEWSLGEFCWHDVLHGELKSVGYPYSVKFKE